MTPPRTPELDDALLLACERYGLSPIYQDCVRPLLGMPTRQWPPCCGRDCEPCSVTLAAVARDVQARLGLAATNPKAAEDGAGPGGGVATNPKIGD